jgi:hypothetical protein
MRDWIRGKVEDLKLLVGEWLPRLFWYFVVLIAGIILGGLFI